MKFQLFPTTKRNGHTTFIISHPIPVETHISSNSEFNMQMKCEQKVIKNEFEE